MMISLSWSDIKSYLPILAFYVLPKAINYYRSYKSRPASRIVPLPSKTSSALWILFVTSAIALLSTFPFFIPENIYKLTSLPLRAKGSVLLHRLKAIRPITPSDEALCEILSPEGKTQAKLLYAVYGPDALLNNPLASAGDIDAARAFLIYALPSILTPHLFHVLALGIATSSLLGGKDSARWRNTAMFTALGLASLELALIGLHDNTANIRSVSAHDVLYLHWDVRIWRGVAIAAADALLGWVIWLQATGRAWVSPPAVGERIFSHQKQLELLLLKARGVNVLQSGTVRNTELRRRVEDYWVREGEKMREIREEPEVVSAERNARQRLAAKGLQEQAGQFVDAVLRSGAPPQAAP